MAVGVPVIIGGGVSGPGGLEFMQGTTHLGQVSPGAAGQCIAEIPY